MGLTPTGGLVMGTR
ncbi:hypothetical protein, partial [Acidithiobacillus ferrooxidans]